MKKITLIVICMMAVMVSCKNKGKAEASAGHGDTLTAVIDSIIEENDTTPMPMFLMGNDAKYLQMLYWAQIEEPVKAEDDADDWFNEIHQSWALQDMFRRNAPMYTNLLDDNRIVKLKFIDEVFKDPDGNAPSIGEIHGREEIPSLCARYEFVNSKDKRETHGRIVVTDSYLESRQRLDIKVIESGWDKPTPLPDAIVKQLEKKYEMKVERMCQQATFGKDYIWGFIQFKGAYEKAPKDKNDPDRKSALALDVLIKGNEVYVHEQLGYYDDSFGPTWNADDEGEYVGSRILAAFEGPKGPELCFSRSAPESTTVGMFYLRDGKFVECVYEVYHNMIDEEIPVWKRDFAEMARLYYADESGDKSVKFSKWSHCYIDFTNEWIWLRDKDDKNGAFFIRKDGKFKLIAIENPRFRPLQCQKDGISYLKLSGPAGGPSWQDEIHAFKNGEQIEKFNSLKVYGEIDECSLNGKTLSKEEGQAYLDQIPEGKQITAYFKDMLEQ